MSSRQPPTTRPTIRDVAALAGTSLKTVSRVINGEARVSPELHDRVRLAIDRLGYRHNLTASNLRRGGSKSRSVGLLLSNVVNPLDGAVHRAIEDAAHDRGIAVLAASLDESPQRERDLVEAFSARRVDGLIVMPAGHDQSYLAEERRMGISIVFVDRPPAFFDADSILVDNREASRRAIAHLVSHGHRRIGYLGDLRTITTAADRHLGYLEGLADAGLPVDSSIVCLDLRDSEQARHAAGEQLALAEPPTAFFTGQNLVTIGAVRALRERKLHDRIALVGFDEVPLGDLLEPALTVIAQDAQAIGAQAAETLFRRIDGDPSPTRTYVIPTMLLVRGSGEIPSSLPPAPQAAG